VEVWGSYSSDTSDSHSVKVSIPPKSTPSLSVVSQQQSGSMGHILVIPQIAIVVGLLAKIRVGRVTVNTHIFLGGLWVGKCCEAFF
jgi:hypothetical protein